MKRIKNNFLLLTIGMLSIFSACAGNADEVAKIRSAIKVEIEQVKIADGSSGVSYSGTIEESETYPMAFSTMGTVSRVYVSEGDAVKKGQLLAELNDESFKNMYELSLATLKHAEDAYKRLEAMYKNGNYPEIKFIEIQTDLQKAKSSAAIAKKNLDDCKLYSTESGIVGKRSIEPGMSALSNTTPITIVKIEKVLARVSVSENEISAIKKGMKARIKVAALYNSEFTGTVEEVGVIAEPMAHTYKIKIGIQNKNMQIKPGMICSVQLERPDVNNTLIVSSRAVLVDEFGNNFVYALDSKNKAIRKYVTTGALLNNGIEIKGGLNIGENVVIAGHQNLTDNAQAVIASK